MTPKIAYSSYLSIEIVMEACVWGLFPETKGKKLYDISDNSLSDHIDKISNPHTRVKMLFKAKHGA